MWQKIRSGVMFGIACVASPCCTPLIVTLGISLLAGTPIAVWLSAHLSWIYGGLTLISIASFVLAFRWMGQKAASNRFTNAESQTAVKHTHEINPLWETKMTTYQNDQQALACDLTAIPEDSRGEHVVSASQLFGTAQEVQELLVKKQPSLGKGRL